MPSNVQSPTESTQIKPCCSFIDLRLVLCSFPWKLKMEIEVSLPDGNIQQEDCEALEIIGNDIHSLHTSKAYLFCMYLSLMFSHEDMQLEMYWCTNSVGRSTDVVSLLTTCLEATHAHATHPATRKHCRFPSGFVPTLPAALSLRPRCKLAFSDTS